MECHFSNISGRMLWNEKDTLVQFGERTCIHYSWQMMCCISHVFSHRMSTFVFILYEFNLGPMSNTNESLCGS